MVIRVLRTTPDHADFGLLVGRLDTFLKELNGDRQAFYAPHNASTSIRHAVVAFVEEEPVGCGAFRPINGGTVEIKRMYVSPDLRVRGIGYMILRELESWAFELGYREAILETSRRLGPALRLYENGGYRAIPNFEPYADAPDSICLGKSLVG